MAAIDEARHRVFRSSTITAKDERMRRIVKRKTKFAIPCRRDGRKTACDFGNFKSKVMTAMMTTQKRGDDRAIFADSNNRCF